MERGGVRERGGRQAARVAVRGGVGGCQCCAVLWWGLHAVSCCDVVAAAVAAVTATCWLSVVERWNGCTAPAAPPPFADNPAHSQSMQRNRLPRGDKDTMPAHSKPGTYLGCPFVGQGGPLVAASSCALPPPVQGLLHLGHLAALLRCHLPPNHRHTSYHRRSQGLRGPAWPAGLPAAVQAACHPSVRTAAPGWLAPAAAGGPGGP